MYTLLFKAPNRTNPVVVSETLSGTKIKIAHIGFLREALVGGQWQTDNKRGSSPRFHAMTLLEVCIFSAG